MEVTNPDRVLFPADGITKLELVEHYERVGSRFLEFAAGRPLTLQRFPSGIETKGFMQKNAADYFPASIARYEVPKRDGGTTRYPVIERVDDLAYLANQGTITFHMWTSTVDEPSHPDWMVLDLDPDVDDIEGVRTASLEVRDLLDEFGLASFPLATGSKGFHAWVPLTGELEYGDVALAARALAGLAVLREPGRLTTEFLKRNRAGRVFVDWLRAGMGATVVVPFSARPRPGAPIAAPLRWDEVAEASPNQWSIRDLDDRLDVPTDVERQHLPVDEIVSAARSAGVDLDTPHDRFGRR